jgi:c-di-GMP-binding flagellar brake protein YcgR
MSKMREKEGRKSYRLKAYHLVKYTLVFGGQELGKPVLGAIKDISAGGACLRAEEEIPVATTLKLEINLPGIPEPVTALAKVVWTRQIGQAMRYEIGTQFLEIDEHMRKVIEENTTFVRLRVEETKKKKGFFDFFRRGRR